MSEIIWKKHNEFMQIWRKYKDNKGVNIEREGEAKWKALNNDLIAASAQIRERNKRAQKNGDERQNHRPTVEERDNVNIREVFLQIFTIKFKILKYRH